MYMLQCPMHSFNPIELTSDRELNRVVCIFQIYPTDQSASSYSSNPSTPVSSPPPLTGGSGAGWPPSASAGGPSANSPHFVGDRTSLTLVRTHSLPFTCTLHTPV